MAVPAPMILDLEMSRSPQQVHRRSSAPEFVPTESFSVAVAGFVLGNGSEETDSTRGLRKNPYSRHLMLLVHGSRRWSVPPAGERNVVSERGRCDSRRYYRWHHLLLREIR